ncbi:MAG: c-type cytochrome [Gammaproteobacteria bacterium]
MLRHPLTLTFLIPGLALVFLLVAFRSQDFVAAPVLNTASRAAEPSAQLAPVADRDNVTERIRPIGQVEIVRQDQPAPEQTGEEVGKPQTSVVTAQPPPVADPGVYRRACGSCHDRAGHGLPRIGDRAAWSALFAEGIDRLAERVTQGFPGHPPVDDHWPSEPEIRQALHYVMQETFWPAQK